MKHCLRLLFFLSAHTCFGQTWDASFNRIDDFVQTVSATTPDSLAYKLTTPYTAELQKVRAIFSWITHNIGYNTAIYQRTKNWRGTTPQTDPTDTMTLWKTGDEMMAIRVMHRKATVCEGYAKLFKVLCDYAGLESKIIFGYSAPGMDKIRFGSNHTWNAVQIDSNWYLLDATWASGYINYQNQFVRQLDERYFLTPPQQFIKDHYPEDLRWALLGDVPSIHEFSSSPFRYRCFDKYSIRSNQFTRGYVDAFIGDTIQIELAVQNVEADEKISPASFFDTTVFAQTKSSAFLQPFISGNKIVYTHVVQANDVNWLHLFYNNDLVLRYRLKIKTKDE